MSPKARRRVREADRKRVCAIIDELIQLEIETRSTATQEDAKIKRRKARRAISGVGLLIDELAGWAVNEIFGSVILEDDGLDPVDPTANEVETIGRRFDSIDDPKIARHALGALLFFLQGPADKGLFLKISIAMRALDFAEVHPIVQSDPEAKSRGSRHTLARFRLRAIMHVEFRVGWGFKKNAALKSVADAYGVPSSTIERWRTRDLLRYVGEEELKNIRNWARDQGEAAQAANSIPAEALEFTDQQLSSDAEDFKQVKWEDKNANEVR